MSDDGKTAKSQQPEDQTRGDLADAPNFQQTLKPGQGVNVPDLRVDQEIVMRLRAYSHLAHAAASWGFAGEGFWMDRGADLIEEQAAEIERLREELNASVGFPQSVADLIEEQGAEIELLKEELKGWRKAFLEDDRDERYFGKMLKAQAEVERLGRELNRAKYGDPDFSWEAHQAALDAAHAEIERLHLLLAERALDEKGPGDEAEAS